MFGKKSTTDEKSVEKLSGPKEVPAPVQSYMVTQLKRDPDWVKILKSVVRKSQNSDRAWEIRIFDQSDTDARRISVANYTSLDEHPEAVIYEGWFDEGSKKVELQEKNKVVTDTPILSEAEIQQKIDGMTEGGSTVFFYLSMGPGEGGPLGRGCAIIEFNPAYPGKKEKKYNLYTTDVVDGQPRDKGQRLSQTDKSKDLAKWVKERHQKRTW